MLLLSEHKREILLSTDCVASQRDVWNTAQKKRVAHYAAAPIQVSGVLVSGASVELLTDEPTSDAVSVNFPTAVGFLVTGPVTTLSFPLLPQQHEQQHRSQKPSSCSTLATASS
eukprot:Selendium_serpulae@DN5530_c0_g1_i4.p1